MIIAVDFSRTLEDSDSVPPGKNLGPPINGAKEALEELMRQGHEVIIHTALANNSDGVLAVAKWLQYFDIPYTNIWTYPGKPSANCYIDDKAVRFLNWEKAMSDIIGKDGPTTRSKQRPSVDNW